MVPNLIILLIRLFAEKSFDFVDNIVNDFIILNKCFSLVGLVSYICLVIFHKFLCCGQIAF